MSSNGASSPRLKSPTSPVGSMSQTLSETRLSLDSDRSSTPSPFVHSNGHTLVNGSKKSDDDEPSDHQLERTREEKETLAAQYRNLLAKLTTMRTTLGNKLKQDAEELDRREVLVQQLQAQNDDLTSTVEMLKEELISTSAEAERASGELDNMRSRAFEESAQENLVRERELRETQTELERCRMEKDEWERMALQDKVVADEARSNAEMYRRDLELEREARERDAAELESERGKIGQPPVSKDHELRQAVKDYNSQLTQVTQSLAEYKHRALTAELQLEETQTNTSRTQELEKEVKEKTLLIEKLRHEAIIINEHLMEALRRLRRNSTDTNVDRRLVTNVLLSFLTTPRADPKRFEMLSLLASVLSWSDPSAKKPACSARKPGTDKSDETESFSRLWVEFLLTEANSLPGTPTSPNMPSNLKAPGTRRLASFGQQQAVAGVPANVSSPNLLALGSPPAVRKGKEKEGS
ncbi:hypothetical protein B0H14DRAFT_2991517 [Mycena olivaceomarginata]|nr:hypothetical protein B0H14DRAFT_2991517 [Mycena olivaceomarginata]